MVPLHDHRNGATAHERGDKKSQNASRSQTHNQVDFRQSTYREGLPMANRRIEMHEYRQVIHRMRQGQSDRAIAKAKLMGRLKCAWVRSIAREKGWLRNGPLPDDLQLSKIFTTPKTSNPTQTSLTQPYEKQIETWVGQGVQATTTIRR